MNSHGRQHTAVLHRATSGIGLSSAQGEHGTHILTVLGRRRKSPSPDTRVRVNNAKTDVSNIAKKKHSNSRSSHADAIPAEDTPLPIYDIPVDRGRKQRSRTAVTTQSRMSVENASVSINHHRGPHISSRKERSQSRDGSNYMRKAPHTHIETSLGALSRRHLADTQLENGALITTAETKRMQEKIEFLKKCIHDNKKVIKKQQKTIDNMEKRLQIEAKVVSDKDDEMRKLRLKFNKNEELISIIETNMQCQICMDLLHKPYALPPCGHILCMACLQEWFRQAPVEEDDMYDDNSDFLLNRRKTCPCCRTVVRSRPIPVFLVKTIATSIMKVKPQLRVSPSRQSNQSSPVDDDPWEDLFPYTDDDDYSYEGAHSDEDEEDEGDEEEDDVHESGSDFGSSSGSDEEPLFVPAQWEPPDLHIQLQDQNLTPEQLSMVRRGATKEMIARYNMEYTHVGGLMAIVNGPGRKRSFIFLGWNIKLNPDDRTGQEYIDWVFDDMVARPERWLVTEVTSRKQEVTALIPAKDVREYLTTDTEAWTDDEDME